MAVCLYVNIEELTTEEMRKLGLSLLKEPQPGRMAQIGRMKNPSDQARSLGAGLLLQYMAVKYLKEPPFSDLVNSTATRCMEKEDDPFPPAELLTVEEIPVAALLKAVEDTLEEAKELTFGKTEAGSPFVEGLGAFVSLSHKGSLVLCAMAGRPCGVDIEYTDPAVEDRTNRFSKHQSAEEHTANASEKGKAVCKESGQTQGLHVETGRQKRERLASRYFFTEEKQMLEEASYSQEKWQKTFCRMWCYKEAYGKMKGTGLKDGLLFNMHGKTKEKVSFYDIHTDFGYVGELCLLEEN